MAHITFIHGMANKPKEEVLEILWKNALAKDNPKPEVFPSPNDGIDLDTYSITSQMVYWSDVLYKDPDNDTSSYGYEAGINESHFEGISRNLSLAQFEAPVFDFYSLKAEEREAVQNVAHQLGVDVDHPDELIPSSKELGRAIHGSYQLERIPLPWFIKKQIMKILLRDVHHYLFNSNSNPRDNEIFKVRDELQSRLLKVLEYGAQQEGPHILISHSMGTIISYDVLRNRPDCPVVDHFITLGSPLGLDEVQDKLKNTDVDEVDFPSEKVKGRWLNFFDKLDPVAGFDPYFANDYLKGG